jgi:hypothetical protein
VNEEGGGTEGRRGMRERRRTREDWTGAEKRRARGPALVLSGSGGRVPSKSAHYRKRTELELAAGAAQGAGRRQGRRAARQAWGWGRGWTAGANGCKASQDWDRICCTAPRQKEGRCTAKTQSTSKAPAPAAAPAAAATPAPRSGSEDTEMVHKRHKDAVLWPTISLGQVEDVLAVGWMLGGGVSTESIYLLLHCKVGERSVCARQTPTPARTATKQR